MAYEVPHWNAGYNERGDAANPDNVTHGMSAADAVTTMVGHMRYFAQVAETEEEQRAFTNAADLYDLDAAPPGDVAILRALEEGARLYGPAVQRHGKGALSHVTRGIEFWVMPCSIKGCKESEEEQG